jgi:hypothetical protein
MIANYRGAVPVTADITAAPNGEIGRASARPR